MTISAAMIITCQAELVDDLVFDNKKSLAKLILQHVMQLSRTALAAGTTGPVACDVLVVGRGATALALLAECLPDRSMVGSLAWADTNFKGESAIASRVHKSAFCFSTAPSDGACHHPTLTHVTQG